MSAEDEGLPILPHLASEFYTWLWWSSEELSGVFDLADPVGRVDVWVDERLAFRNPNDTKITATMTGENPSSTLEARAALAGGKVLQELRVGVRRDDREFFTTLKGPAMHLSGLKLPQVVNEGGEEVLYDRMHLYEELCFILAGLVQQYADVRNGPHWDDSVFPRLRGWIIGEG
mgnify:CR=1 FL=1